MRILHLQSGMMSNRRRESLICGTKCVKILNLFPQPVLEWLPPFHRMLALKLTSFTVLDLVESILCSDLFHVEEKEQCMRREPSHQWLLHMFQPQHVTVSQLHSYIDPNQLTEELGGSLQYSHRLWLHNRLVRRLRTFVCKGR